MYVKAKERPFKRRVAADAHQLTPSEARSPFRLVGDERRGFALYNDHTGEQAPVCSHRWEKAVAVLRAENQRHLNRQ